MSVIKYFNLNEDPFRIGPDARFLYFSEQVKEALAKCECMARERIGPVYMYGPIGAGKTTIIRRLYERLSQDKLYNVAYLISPNMKSSNIFLRMILETFQVKTERAFDHSLRNFEFFLTEQYQSEKVPLLLVDEAQYLSRDALKLVHYLLNFETATTKLLQIVLVGQEELAAKILRYKELASRMFPIAMNALSFDDMKAMIRFRWIVAGGNEHENPFNNDDIYKALFAYSKGLPREVVKICGQVLLDLMAVQGQTAYLSQVEALAQELNLQKEHE